MVYLLKDRVEVPVKIQQYIEIMENLSGNRLVSIRSDRGAEYSSNGFKNYLADNGTTQQTTAGYSPQSNGIAERFNRTLLGGAKANLYQSKLPDKFWSYAVLSSIHNKITRNNYLLL